MAFCHTSRHAPSLPPMDAQALTAGASTGTTMLRSSPSALPELTFLPVLEMVLRTVSYERLGSAMTVALWLSRETS